MTDQTDKLKQLNGELCAEINEKDRRIRELESLVRDMWPLICKYKEMATTFAYQPGIDEAMDAIVAIGKQANIRERIRALGVEVDG